MNDVVPSQPEPPQKKTPIPAGAAYIGMSNTRGVVMQIHAQRFQQALTLNLAGLAGFVGWISASPHDKPVLVISAIGCGMFIVLNVFWSVLLFATVAALHRWTGRIEALIDDLGIEGHLDPGKNPLAPNPPLSGWSLYMVLVGCIVGWGILLILILVALKFI